jgi:hypothetical protein
MISKKAIAPLVSTILLIVFASILGAIVMGWGEQHKSDADCDDQEIAIINSGTEPCLSSERVVFTVENAGVSQIAGIRISVIGKDSVYQLTDDSRLDSGEAKKMKLSFDNNLTGEVSSVRISPIVENTGRKEMCLKKAVESEIRGSCR